MRDILVSSSCFVLLRSATKLSLANTLSFGISVGFKVDVKREVKVSTWVNRVIAGSIADHLILQV